MTSLDLSVGGLSKEASTVGRMLLERLDDSTGFERAYGATQLHEKVPFLSPEEFNDAVDELQGYGLVETIRTFGTAPYNFHELSPTYALFIHFKDAGLDYDPFDDIRAVAAAVVERGETDGRALQDSTKLSPVRLNRAVAYLNAFQYADVLRTMGTAPFDFAEVSATRRTRDFVRERCR